MSTYDLSYTGTEIDSAVDTLNTILTGTTAAKEDIAAGKTAVTSSGLVTGTAAAGSGGSGTKKATGYIDYYRNEPLNLSFGFRPSLIVAYILEDDGVQTVAWANIIGSEVEYAMPSQITVSGTVANNHVNFSAHITEDGIVDWVPFMPMDIGGYGWAFYWIAYGGES